MQLKVYFIIKLELMDSVRNQRIPNIRTVSNEWEHRKWI